MLNEYFDDRGSRIYDMLNFIDFYGKKKHILSQKEFKKSDK